MSRHHDVQGVCACGEKFLHRGNRKRCFDCEAKAEQQRKRDKQDRVKTAKRAQSAAEAGA